MQIDLKILDEDHLNRLRQLLISKKGFTPEQADRAAEAVKQFVAQKRFRKP